MPDAGRPRGSTARAPWCRGWKLVEILPELTRRAVEWVEEAGERRQAILPLFPPDVAALPGRPRHPSSKGKSQAGDYGDFVAQTDSDGRPGTRRAASGPGAPTTRCVIFTSDNGPEVTGEVNPGVYDRANSSATTAWARLRGAKRDVWEGRTSRPFLARWPGKDQARAP